MSQCEAEQHKQHQSRLPAACLHKALDTPLSGLVLEIKLLCCFALLHPIHPPLPEAMLDIQHMKATCSRKVCGLMLLLVCLLLQLHPSTLCMLSQGVPGLKGAVASEQVMEGDGNILKVGLPCLMLSASYSTRRGCDIAPCLHYMCSSHYSICHILKDSWGRNNSWYHEAVKEAAA